MQVRVGTPGDILSRPSLPVPDGLGWAVMPAEDLWGRVRAWADSEGHEHTYAQVVGVAPT